MISLQLGTTFGMILGPIEHRRQNMSFPIPLPLALIPIPCPGGMRGAIGTTRKAHADTRHETITEQKR